MTRVSLSPPYRRGIRIKPQPRDGNQGCDEDADKEAASTEQDRRHVRSGRLHSLSEGARQEGDHPGALPPEPGQDAQDPRRRRQTDPGERDRTGGHCMARQSPSVQGQMQARLLQAAQRHVQPARREGRLRPGRPPVEQGHPAQGVDLHRAVRHPLPPGQARREARPRPSMERGTESRVSSSTWRSRSQ